MKSTSRRKILRVVAFGLIALVIGCVWSLFSRSGRLATLFINEQRWAITASQHYRYTFNECSFGGIARCTDVMIEVKAGVLQSVVEKDSHMPLESRLFVERRVDSIEHLFEVLRRSINVRPDAFLAWYNVILGYPEQVDITYNRNASDNEVTYTISNVEMLP